MSCGWCKESYIVIDARECYNCNKKHCCGGCCVRCSSCRAYICPYCMYIDDNKTYCPDCAND